MVDDREGRGRRWKSGAGGGTTRRRPGRRWWPSRRGRGGRSAGDDLCSRTEQAGSERRCRGAGMEAEGPPGTATQRSSGRRRTAASLDECWGRDGGGGAAWHGDAEEQRAATDCGVTRRVLRPCPSKPLAPPVKAAAPRAVGPRHSSMRRRRRSILRARGRAPTALLPWILHGWAWGAADEEDEGGEQHEEGRCGRARRRASLQPRRPSSPPCPTRGPWSHLISFSIHKIRERERERWEGGLVVGRERRESDWLAPSLRAAAMTTQQ